MNCITVKNLVTKYHNRINWNLAKGEIHGIIGPSGEGKSYLLKTILGLQQKISGEILDENGQEFNYLNSKIGVQFQTNVLMNNMTIGENIMMPLIMKFNIPYKYAKQIAQYYMNLVNLDEVVFNYFPLECSGGMQKRASFAMTLVLEPEILFLDEPTAGIDCVLLEQYDALLSKLAKTRNISIVMVTHDLSRLVKIADRISILMEGQIYTDTFAQLQKSDNFMIKEFLESYVRTIATF
jgi:phospholipid/cholesterol/gamma-HCH transport system ATP-binding protein